MRDMSEGNQLAGWCTVKFHIIKHQEWTIHCRVIRH